MVNEEIIHSLNQLSNRVGALHTRLDEHERLHKCPEHNELGPVDLTDEKPDQLKNVCERLAMIEEVHPDGICAAGHPFVRFWTQQDDGSQRTCPVCSLRSEIEGWQRDATKSTMAILAVCDCDGPAVSDAVKQLCDKYVKLRDRAIELENDIKDAHSVLTDDGKIVKCQELRTQALGVMSYVKSLEAQLATERKERELQHQGALHWKQDADRLEKALTEEEARHKKTIERVALYSGIIRELEIDGGVSIHKAEIEQLKQDLAKADEERDEMYERARDAEREADRLRYELRGGA